jgi:leucyl-tRNA synthetase
MIKQNVRPISVLEKFILIVAPYAPHICEELWSRLGHSDSLVYEPWPKYDEKLTQEKEIELAVQIKGKIKDRIIVPSDANEDFIKEKALASTKVITAMAGKQPRKIIVVKSRLVNIII